MAKTLNLIDRIKNRTELSDEEANSIANHYKALLLRILDDPADKQAMQEFKRLDRFMMADRKNRPKYDEFMADVKNIGQVKNNKDVQNVREALRNAHIPTPAEVSNRRAASRSPGQGSDNRPLMQSHSKVKPVAYSVDEWNAQQANNSGKVVKAPVSGSR
jgi:hypothetical protein